MKIHRVEDPNRIELTYKSVDIRGRVPDVEGMEFLRLELPYHDDRPYGPFARVRYAIDGIEKPEYGIALDISKPVVLNVSDPELELKIRQQVALPVREIAIEYTAQERVERVNKAREEGIYQGAKENAIESILETLELRFKPNGMLNLKSDLECIDELQILKKLRRAALLAKTLKQFTHTLEKHRKN